MKGDWGFHPRYEAKYPFSIKTRKYEAQTREETYNDMPRLRVHDLEDERTGIMPYNKVNSMIMTWREHNR